MKNALVREVKDLKAVKKGHILYFFENEDLYIAHIVDFVISGIQQNQYVIIIENDRIAPIIKRKLASLLTIEQSLKVIVVNNFDFYYAKGDFASNSIFEYLPDMIEGYSAKGADVRSWAHVEWRDEEEASSKLTAAESEAVGIVEENNLLSVCAYNSERVTSEFKARLLGLHNYLLKN
ncbi:MEDS domain-containing protein [Metabacillus sp. GX 13764]|uniref:MEDS domain-containing protein n=1 Tax=Metabacillus kandeliae TaxID=2900151 RepID=UPI001E3A5BEB|nr:MEDS domain-containing protein [Metabacillus kandeliae]MCD7036345.1 MEDS domain-containing protein [Metabacillus kandeliae]